MSTKKTDLVSLEEALKHGIEEYDFPRIVERMGRNPNEIECLIFAKLWSETYSNKNSSALLATLYRGKNDLASLHGSSVGLLDIGNNRTLALYAVSNNKQGYAEPFLGAQAAFGAATDAIAGVGAKPIAALNLLRFGAINLGINQGLLQKAVSGLASFSNAFGIPNIGGEVYFHKNYNGSVVMNTCVLGVAHTDSITKKEAAKTGFQVLYVGAATSIDGLSDALRPKKEAIQTKLLTGKEDQVELSVEEEKQKRKILGEQVAMRISDPFLAKQFADACTAAINTGYMSAYSMLHTGGLATACIALTGQIGKAIRVNLNRIPIRFSDLTSKEILFSETPERMLFIASGEHQRELVKLFQQWDLNPTVIGEITDYEGLEYIWNGKTIADIPFNFALKGGEEKVHAVVKFPPMLKRKASDDDDRQKVVQKRKKRYDNDWAIIQEVTEKNQNKFKKFGNLASLEDTLIDLLASPNLCSRAHIYQNFDQAIGSNSIIQAGGDAALVRIEEDDGTRKRAIAISVDSNSLYVSQEAYLGSVQTVAEAMRNISATGAKPIAIAHSLNYGNPNDYKEISDLAESIRGIGDACKIWDIPIISDHVSLFNGSTANQILPTPTICMIGLLEDASLAVPAAFQNRGDKIFLLGTTNDEIACSEYTHYCHKHINPDVPNINFEHELKMSKFVQDSASRCLLSSCHDLSGGGLGIAFAECCLTSPQPIGATLEVYQPLKDTKLRDDILLFSETSARFLVSCAPTKEEAFKEFCAAENIPITAEGEVGGKNISFEGELECVVPLSTAYRVWSGRMAQLLGLGKVREES